MDYLKLFQIKSNKLRFCKRFRKCSESDFKILLWVRAIDVARAFQSIIPTPRMADRGGGGEEAGAEHPLPYINLCCHLAPVVQAQSLGELCDWTLQI